MTFLFPGRPAAHEAKAADRITDENRSREPVAVVSAVRNTNIANVELRRDRNGWRNAAE
ncbi:hypothetical protein [Bradyrhizobium sp.]|uniref:hypothetical protein n=1 Tax=Bradyrhizobium sp. TaxID=376 RepID=UPI004037CB7E